MTFTIKTRGAPRLIASEFRCELHGVFTALASSNDNDFASCPTCGLISPWSPSKAPVMRMRRVEATRGNHERPQHKGWLDTSNLEEGQDPDEWQAERDAVNEQLDEQMIMDAIRSDS